MMSDKKSQRTPYSNVQVVIMANRPAFTRDSFGDSQLFGFIPIGNKPILAHLLEQFEKNSFSNISIVCLCKDVAAYEEFLVQYTTIPVRLIPVEGNITTCDIIRNKIGTDNHIFMFPIDLITSENLTSIYDFHASTQSLITIVTTKFAIEPSEIKNAPGFQGARPSTSHRYFVFDQNNPTKLLSLLSDSESLATDLDLSLKQDTLNDFDHEDSIDSMASSEASAALFEDSMSIDPSLLEGFHSLTVDCSQTPTNAYLLSPACIQILREQPFIHSIESEFIPFLCRDSAESSALSSTTLQYNQPEHPHSSIFCIGEKEFAYRVTDYNTLFITNLKCATTKLRGFSPAAAFEPTSADGQLGFFREGETKAHSSFKFTPFCVYGINFNAAEDVTITRSVIGRHCKIGKNVKIINSVLFDHVTVDEGVQIRDCIIGSDSVIHANSTFKQCIIPPRYSSTKPVNKNACFVRIGEEQNNE